MTEREILLEQAQLLRTLAETFETPTVRSDLHRLAERCESMAERRDAPALRTQPEPQPER